MDEGIGESRYWCHMCSQMVNPIMEVEIKCPFCQSGFVEEMGTTANHNNQNHNIPDTDFGSDRALSLWAPILLGMMGHSHPHHRRFRRLEFEEDDNDGVNNYNLTGRGMRRNSVAFLQLFPGIQAESESESNVYDSHRVRDRDRDTNRGREIGRLIMINPFNQTIIYGTPPAQKEAVQAMPSVKIIETFQCSVCLDDFEIGTEAKEMPCKHMFHSECILPWLELHSSCPVCRYQMPADESKLDSERSRASSNQRETERSSNSGHGTSEEADGEGRNESGRRFSIPWPFNGMFSSSSSHSEGNNSTSSSGSETNEN